jgi:hypothetical protein
MSVAPKWGLRVFEANSTISQLQHFVQLSKQANRSCLREFKTSCLREVSRNPHGIRGFLVL